jgi:hypothetical protein
VLPDRSKDFQPGPEEHPMSETNTTKTPDSRQALAWIARQLRWEQTLADLRAERGADERRDDEDRQAA